MVQLIHRKYEDLMGIVVDINVNPPPGLDPMPIRVQWFSPPEGYPKAQSLKAKWLEVVS